MINKWILGSTLSTLVGIVAASIYLMLIQPMQDGSNLPNYHAEWLLWFFLAMVLISMLVNLSVLIAPPTKWLNLMHLFSISHNNQKNQFDQFQQLVQLFLQQQQQHLQRLTSQADIYIWTPSATPVVVQVATEGNQQAGIAEMRQLFRWMLAHQCRQGYFLSMHAPDLQAEIFAKEAGISFVDVQTLQKLHSSSDT